MDVGDSENRITVSEASRLGLPTLVREVEAEGERVLVRDGEAVAVLMSMERYGQWQEAWDDLIDITMVASRMLTAGPERLSLDEVLARFGYTREELVEMTE